MNRYDRPHHRLHPSASCQRKRRSRLLRCSQPRKSWLRKNTHWINNVNPRARSWRFNGRRTSTQKFEKNQGELLPSRSDLAQDGGLQSTEGTRVRTLNGSLAPPSHVLLEHGPDVPLSKLRHSIEDGTKRTASKFIDRATMERTILGVLNSNEATITTWLANQPAPGRNLALNSTSDYGLIGVGFQKTASGIEARYDLRSATVVIKSTGHGNYVIQTAFPR